MAGKTFSKGWLVGLVLVATAAVAAGLWRHYRADQGPEGIASGNGRIEATQIGIATKFPGRIAEILAREGDFVEAGQVVARLDTQSLEAQLKQAQAEVHRVRYTASYAQAMVRQCDSQLTVARKDYQRSQALFQSNPHIITAQKIDHDRAAMESASAQLAEAEAKVLEARAAIEAALAKTEEIETNLDDSVLKAPVSGRVLYRLAEPGEVLGAGGKVLSVLELSDVYMTIFLPTLQAGRVALGAEARLVFDALPDIAVPARVSFVAPQAQFTPKQVETRTEREKLMFRIKVRIAPQLLQAHLHEVKTGVPGVAYVRLDSDAPWPDDIQRRSLL